MKIDVLKQVKTLITHDNCPDGLASALIIKDALPDLDVRFMNYNTPEHIALKPQEGVMFCDFTPWVERDAPQRVLTYGFAPYGMTMRGREQAKAWVDAGAVVLDHHEGVADLVAMFGERGVYASATERPGVSGATLAFEEVWCMMCGNQLRLLPSAVEAFAEIAGIRDTWQKKDARWRDACVQAAALMFWPRDLLLAEGLRKVMTDRMGVGEVILAQQAAADKKTLAEAHRFTAGDVRVVCFEGQSREASDVAELVGSEADMVIAWHYLMQGGAPQMRLSCRGRGSFKVLPFVQSLGGNGHAFAAGCQFVLSEGADAQSPYRMIEALVREFLDR